MDGVQAHPSSPPLTSTDAHTTFDLHLSLSPATTHSERYFEPGSTRQRRLLQGRNARFPAKKLSLSNLSARFSQLIHANDEIPESTLEKDQENKPSREKATSAKNHTPARSLGILDEITSSNRKARQSGNFLIHQDTPERPLLERSPFSSPADSRQQSSNFSPPVGFDYIQDSLGSMRLREISGNEQRGSPLTKSSTHGSVRGLKVRKPIQLKAGFDTEEYIEHIEKELQQVRSEMYSPNTNKSLREQLRTARNDNEKMRQDMTDMKAVFEKEVKRSIDAKAQMEVELKRQLRDLEEEVEHKTSMIRDLELHYEEKRLDSHTMNDLKAAIERLEQDKLSLEDENRSMNKRNEVLSELLAMSPIKMQSFELRSPVREKRGGRPMSMILPRLPSSPTGRQLGPAGSVVASPASSAGGPFFSNWKSRPNSPRQDALGSGASTGEGFGMIGPYFSEDGRAESHISGHVRSRRSTLQSQSSMNDTASVDSGSSFIDRTVQRLPKRKPRKFMSGSTQLKPLLLPTITGEPFPLSASSMPSSPMSEALNDISQDSIDPTTYFLSQSEESHVDQVTLQSVDNDAQSDSRQDSESVTNSYRNFEEIMAEDAAIFATEVVLKAQSQAEQPLYALPPPQAVHQSPTVQNVHTPLRSTDICTGDQMTGECETDDQQSTPDWQQYENQPELALRSLSYPTGLDLNALRRLDFPEPDFDAIPHSRSSSDRRHLADVPEPLFSSHAHMGIIVPASSHTDERYLPPLSQSEDLLRNRTSDRLSLVINERNISPGAKSRSSWHASTDTRWTQLQRLPTADSTPSKFSDSSQRSTSRMPQSLTRARSPLEILHAGRLGARPLASTTIRTIFGTIAQCTGHLRNFKRDPLALARRVIANAWFSNWKRFGKLSWWVLGLFISTGVGGPKLEEWDWTQYDPEAIAQNAFHNNGEDVSSDTQVSQQNTRSTAGINKRSHSDTTTVVPTKDKTGWGESIMLWGKFSMAIMLAVGGAVVKGPGEMLKDIDSSAGIDSHRSSSSLDHTCSGRHRKMPNSVTRDHSIEGDAEARRDPRTHNNYSIEVEHMRTGRPSIRESRDHLSSHQDHDDSFADSFSSSSHADDDATLRAQFGPRTHVANLFQRRRSHMNDHIFGNGSQSMGPVLRPPNIDRDLSGGTVQWPSSPGRFLSRQD